jgi:hypothetical protein
MARHLAVNRHTRYRFKLCVGHPGKHRDAVQQYQTRCLFTRILFSVHRMFLQLMKLIFSTSCGVIIRHIPTLPSKLKGELANVRGYNFPFTH